MSERHSAKLANGEWVYWEHDPDCPSESVLQGMGVYQSNLMDEVIGRQAAELAAQQAEIQRLVARVGELEARNELLMEAVRIQNDAYATMQRSHAEYVQELEAALRPFAERNWYTWEDDHGHKRVEYFGDVAELVAAAQALANGEKK